MEPDQPQQDRTAAGVIAQQSSSATLISHNEKFRRAFQKLFNYLHKKSLRSENRRISVRRRTFRRIAYKLLLPCTFEFVIH
jgi:hypothetical protein